MMTFRALAAHAIRFRRDENGSATVEAMLMIPVLAWFFLATFVFFDAFRMQSVNIKASYTIGDTLSRETGYVTSNYLNGLFSLQDFLLDTDEQRGLQITAYTFNQSRNRYEVRWSKGLGGMPALTTADLSGLRDILPVMPGGEIAILTRSRVHYRPVYEIGLDDFTFDEYTVTRPRFAPQLCWNTSATASASTAIC